MALVATSRFSLLAVAHSLAANRSDREKENFRVSAGNFFLYIIYTCYNMFVLCGSSKTVECSIKNQRFHFFFNSVSSARSNPPVFRGFTPFLTDISRSIDDKYAPKRRIPSRFFKLQSFAWKKIQTSFFQVSLVFSLATLFSLIVKIN